MSDQKNSDDCWYHSGRMILCDEKNPYFGFIREKQSSDPFGLSKLKRYFSDCLFPHFSTLMPNLVYLYILLPIHDYYIENKKEIKETPNKSEFIDEISMHITTKLDLISKNKGFHGDVQSQSVFTNYRETMRYLKMIECENSRDKGSYNVFPACENLQKEFEEYCNGYKNYNELDKIIKNTTRYQAIWQFCKEDRVPASAECPPTLTKEEKKDFILRLIYRSSKSKFDRNKKVQDNLFETICKYYLLEKQLKKNNDIKLFTTFENLIRWIVKANDDNKADDDQDCEVWAIDQKGNEQTGNNYDNLFIVYYMARKCSLLEHILNVGYNVCIKNEDINKNEEPSYYKLLKNCIEGYKKDAYQDAYQYNAIYEGLKCHVFNDKFLKPKNKTELEESLDFLNELNTKLLDEAFSISNVLNLIKEREIKCMGEKSLLNAEVKYRKPINLSPDTYRYEYRDYSESNGSDIEKYFKNQNYYDQRDQRDKLMWGTRKIYGLDNETPLKYCISYFIYELFFET